MKIVEVTDYINQTPSKYFANFQQITQTIHPLSILWKKFYVQDPKKEKKNHIMCTKYDVHIFNVWTIIMQSLNKKEWKLLESQITQTRHPLCILDGKNV